ncbi:hypothetical protein RYX56_05620 [Alkalihalophilus lindianensis]|uniref:Uncharacterized protein n=1 Tax=Alkalihalophilus lindianensis TaxID=1630542 RepID=A0ABU3X7D0_9BACI|nr:hypothetical protein [Alkalihalophilus lindianensis]MDV2683787.1 hypothetical protein [Alkalihalophilus lindianensis]MDV2683853.1 hypothetical protein [Alkalihalophilus lindianensis]
MITTKDEYELILKYIYLPMTRRVIEKDLEKMEASKFKFSDIYLDFFKSKIDWIGKDIGELKREAKRKGIAVHELGVDSSSSVKYCNYLVVVRGQEQEMKVLSHVMANNVRDILRSYVNK